MSELQWKPESRRENEIWKGRWFDTRVFVFTEKHVEGVFQQGNRYFLQSVSENQ